MGIEYGPNHFASIEAEAALNEKQAAYARARIDAFGMDRFIALVEDSNMASDMDNWNDALKNRPVPESSKGFLERGNKLMVELVLRIQKKVWGTQSKEIDGYLGPRTLSALERHATRKRHLAFRKEVEESFEVGGLDRFRNPETTVVIGASMAQSYANSLGNSNVVGRSGIGPSKVLIEMEKNRQQWRGIDNVILPAGLGNVYSKTVEGARGLSSSVVRKVAKMVQLILEENPEAHITIPRRPPYDSTRLSRHPYSKQLAACQKHIWQLLNEEFKGHPNVKLVDTHRALANEKGEIIGGTLSSDNWHLNSTGTKLALRSMVEPVALAPTANEPANGDGA